MERFTWSAEFQRLRAESFFTSLILLSVTQLKLSLTKIPIIGVDIATPAPRGAVALFVWLFACYSIIAWTSKFTVERYTRLRETEVYRGYADKIISQTGDLSNFTFSDLNQLQHAFDRYNQISTTLKGQIDKLLAGVTSFGAPSYEDFTHDQRQAIAGSLRRIQAMNNQVLRPIEDLKIALDDIGTLIENVPNEVATLLKLTEDEAEKIASNIREAGREAVSELENSLSSLNREQKTMFWDRELLGFWIPLCLTILLFLIATPQASIDIVSFVSKFGGDFPSSLFRPSDIN